MDNASDLLRTATDTLSNRAKDRDQEQERAMKRTVEVFNAFTGLSLTEAQGWAFMMFLKAVRGSQGNYRADDYVDGAAYFALWGECLSIEADAQPDLFPEIPA